MTSRTYRLRRDPPPRPRRSFPCVATGALLSLAAPSSPRHERAPFYHHRSSSHTSHHSASSGGFYSLFVISFMVVGRSKWDDMMPVNIISSLYISPLFLPFLLIFPLLLCLSPSFFLLLPLSSSASSSATLLFAPSSAEEEEERILALTSGWIVVQVCRAQRPLAKQTYD